MILIRRINYFNFLFLFIASFLGVIISIVFMLTGLIGHPKIVDVWYHSNILYYLMGGYLVFVVITSVISFINEIILLVKKKTGVKNFFLNFKVVTGWLFFIIILLVYSIVF
ncbi:hypothetical protein [Flavicella sp.]|uniref:hypothetical protein n=1 Tax=Flavicella sp. TaxID=2957742 RepID=UPI00261D64DA|nr:hypothetical protein [Flavicella sp.]MDG1805935.1 hypothetical protein [Flavicella sp.]